MAGIYLHIPFCKQACHYCDFHFSTDRSMETSMVKAIARELNIQRDYFEGESIQTIYFGGGTPSLLREEDLDLLLEEIHKNFKVEKNPEITLEANPDDLSLEKCRGLKKSGFNRLSIGIQSFDNAVLRFINRAHDVSAAERCLANARLAGFGNISLDLIYGIPGQSDAGWESTIFKALEFFPEHISSYSLTIEQKTVFGNWLAKGKLKPVSDDISARQLEILVKILAENGYHQYEVSNFGKAGYYSRHNSSYWQQEKYLGVGPGAHSYNGKIRQQNVRNNHLYVRSIENGKIPFESEVLTREDLINEYLLTTLRTSSGCDTGYLLEQYRHDLLSGHHDYIQTLISSGLAVMENQYLKLTNRGKLLADKIASDLFLISATD